MSIFRPSSKFSTELEADEGYRAAIREQAEAAVPEIERLAQAAGGPWMPRRGASAIVVEQDDEGTYIVNTDFAGHLIEFGSANNPPHAPLRRGASAAGLRLEEDSGPA